MFHQLALPDTFLPCFSVFSVFSYKLGTCANNQNKCSQFGDCKDHSSGYCCNCRPGFYGNGIQCVAEGNNTLIFKQAWICRALSFFTASRKLREIGLKMYQCKCNFLQFILTLYELILCILSWDNSTNKILAQCDAVIICAPMFHSLTSYLCDTMKTPFKDLILSAVFFFHNLNVQCLSPWINIYSLLMLANRLILKTHTDSFFNHLSSPSTFSYFKCETKPVPIS